MKKASKRKTLSLLSSGLFVMAATQISSHYTEMPDSVRGVLMGIGIGLLLTALIFGSFRTAQS